MTNSTMMQPQVCPPLPKGTILDLAPTDLKNLRQTRYDGRNKSASVEEFAPDARRTIEMAYEVTCELQELLRPLYKDTALAEEALQRFLENEDWSQPFGRLAKLRIPEAQRENDELRKVTHDIKGGALTALYGLLQLIELGVGQPEDIPQAYFLARDHAKIMRNALPDLDPPRYEADLNYKLHDVELIAEKWRGKRGREDGKKVEIRSHVEYEGAIATRCMEFSALDRVLYNVLNNAVRHTSGEAIFLSAVAVPQEHPHSLRFVVVNPIDAAQQAAINERTDGEPSRLFDPGVTTDSTGLGLTISSEFVAQAFGLAHAGEAVARQYLGATLVDDYFACWFHWPLVDD
ncbi:HAMP domain-containing histidine kinase [Persicimonas caeni]|uniref:HAMP domain-containing histidine kinase n=2 Tax=Persicimonas caeni TaxID=2292766 RepID=A0A4Y6PSI4_PERCE|nr:HAMP domain-containing histidine kinase [Persicimonas caeni]QDG51296.1 HAMP domain-containing histidine kinase [Persicimonas caeni]